MQHIARQRQALEGAACGSRHRRWSLRGTGGHFSGLLPVLHVDDLGTGAGGGTATGTARGAFEGNRPQRRPQERLDRRLEKVAKAVGDGCCRLQMP